MQMGEMADLIDEHRTAVAARLWPTVDRGGEDEVVNDQLAAPGEQIEQARLAARTLEEGVSAD
jgi:hypothetical protein